MSKTTVHGWRRKITGHQGANTDAEEARRKKRVMERRSIVKLLVLVWLL
jgi:hypothetical protein